MAEYEPKPLYAPRTTEPAYSFGETLDASLKQESGFVNLFDMLSANDFKPDPKFTLYDFFQERPDLVPYQNLFQDVRSRGEALDTEARLRQEEKRRAILAASGFTGFATNFAAGIFSPSTFVPFGAVGRGLRGIGAVATLAGGAAALDEAVLSQNQLTRTAAETRANILATAALGAVLGVGVSALRPAEMVAAAETFGRQEGRRSGGWDSAALPGIGETEGVGAAVANRRLTRTQDPGFLKDVLSKKEFGEASVGRRVMDKTMRLMSKASSLRGLMSEIPEVRGLQAQLADGGLQFKAQADGKVYAPGGTVESRSELKMRTYIQKAQESLDEGYGKYETGKPKLNYLDRTRAEWLGVVPHGGKLSRRQFNEQIFLEMQRPQPSALPEVRELAERLRSEFYSPLFKELQENELLPKDLDETDVVGAAFYLTHVYNKQAIVKDPIGFDQLIMESYQKKMAMEYAHRLEKGKTFEEGAKKDIEDLSRTDEDVSEIQAEIRAQRDEFAKTKAGELAEERAMLKRQLRSVQERIKEGESVDLIGPSGRGFRADLEHELKDRIRDIESRLNPMDRAMIAADNRKRRRSTLLSRAVGRLEVRQQRVVERMEEIEETAIGALRRTAAKAAEFIKDRRGLSDKAYAAGLKSLKRDLKDLEEEITILDAGLARLELKHGLKADGTEFDPTHTVQGIKKEVATAHIEEIRRMLDDAEAEGPEFARAQIEEWFHDVNADIFARQEKLAAAKARLFPVHAKLDPALSRAKIGEIETNIVRRNEDMTEWVRKNGGTLNPDGTVDFTTGGREYAAATRAKIIGDPTRVVSLDLGAERGAEQLRTLDIPIEEKMRYLETDMDKLIRIYARNVVPDVELTKAGMGLNGSVAIDKIRKVYERERQRVAAREDLTPEQKEAEQDRLQRDSVKTEQAFVGQIQRLRHQRAIPDDPDSYLYRGGRLLQQWNVLTMMGNVLAPSLVDPAIAVYKYGFRRVWRHGLKPFIGDIKNLRLSQREALYAGMNDMLLQNRFYQVADLMEDTGRRNGFEKGAEFLANKIGVVGLFSQWTQIMKQWVTPIAAGKILDALDAVMTGNTRWMSQAEAREALAYAHIDGDLAERIWRQQDNGGLVKSGDLWVPNTESWDDLGAVEAFRAAILSQVEGTIVTPGLERPLFVDASMGHKLLFQFQSFMWSSHTKVLMAGLQQRDSAVLEGILVGTALGALSYAVDKMARGEWEEARGQDYGKWTDEIIARSPFLGVFAQAMKIGQAIPGTKDYLTVSDEGTDRRYAGNVLGSLAGPSYTTVNRGLKLLSEVDSPTQSTANTVRQLTPYNNIIWARQAFQKVAESSGLPERRD